jgi:hypothetical protein
MGALDGLFGLRRFFANGAEVPFHQTLEFVGPGISAAEREVFDADGRPFTVQSITLPSGAGSLAATETTASFVQPAVDATVTAAVINSNGMVADLPVFVEGGGTYQVVSAPDATHVTLRNLGYPDNAAPGATVATSAQVVSSGFRGEDGSTGSDLTYPTILLVADSNLTLSGLAQTHQGVAIDTDGMLIGALEQTDGTESAIYVAHAGAWTRADRFGIGDPALPAGLSGLVQSGTYERGRWTLVTEGAVLGTDPLDFNVEQFVSAEGDGLVLRVDADVQSFGKVDNDVIDDNTIALGKIATGGAGDSGKVPTVNGSGVLVLATPSGGGASIEAFDENGTSLGVIDEIAPGWFTFSVASGRLSVTPLAKIPRAMVRFATTANQATPLAISSTQDGLSGSAAVKTGDVGWYLAQSIPTQNGLYWCAGVSGGVATMIKLTLCDQLIADGALYVKIAEGTTHGNKIYKVKGDGSLAAALQMPPVSPTVIPFDRCPVEDFVASTDTVYPPVSANWQPAIMRAQECMFQVGGELLFGSTGYYRITTRIDLYARTALVGTNASSYVGFSASRILVDGCAAVFSPTQGGETWEAVVWPAGIDPMPQIRGLLFSFVNGSNVDTHYGFRFHPRSRLENVTLRAPYGKGVTQDSTTGIGGCNNSYWEDVTVSPCGASAFYTSGGDANNLTMVACRGTNFSTLGLEALEYEPASPVPTTFPGNDWGLIDNAFIGMCTIDCSFSAFHNGGIYALASKSTYVKTYTEAGTDSDTTGCTIIGGKMSLRAGGNATFLPVIEAGTDNATTIPALRTVTSNASQTLGSGGGSTLLRHIAALSGDTTGWSLELNTTGGDTGYITDGRSTGNAAHNLWRSLSNAVDMGGGMAGAFKGFFLGRTRTHVLSRGAAMTGTPTLTFANVGSADTCTRSVGSWISDGFIVGRKVHFGGTVSNNGVTGVLASVTATVLTFTATTALVAEGPVSGAVAFCYLLPPFGVPLTSGSTDHFDGAWPLGSTVREPTAGKGWTECRVIVNAGSATYALTWGGEPNPGGDTVALATGDQTRYIYEAGRFRMAANTLAANSVITLSPVGALKGDVIRLHILSQATYTTTFRNGGAGGTGAQPDKVLAAATEAEAEFKFDGTDWIGALRSCL